MQSGRPQRPIPAAFWMLIRKRKVRNPLVSGLPNRRQRQGNVSREVGPPRRIGICKTAKLHRLQFPVGSRNPIRGAAHPFGVEFVTKARKKAKFTGVGGLTVRYNLRLAESWMLRIPRSPQNGLDGTSSWLAEFSARQQNNFVFTPPLKEPRNGH
jgi:hypothetical protein